MRAVEVNLRPEPFLSPANLVTLLRIPLAVLPWVFLQDRTLIAVIIAAAALSDGLDGYLARIREGSLVREPVRRIGAWLDPVCDKIFMVSTLAALWTASFLSFPLVLMIGFREILLGAAVTAAWVVPAWRPHLRHESRASWLGKITTGAQFATLLAALAGHPAAFPMGIASALIGAAAAWHYVRRATA